MSRVRSPNYPLISLPEAIEKVTVFYDAEQHLAAPKEVVAKHLGYASYHSLAARVISAIEKYGLLEETNGDKVRVSPLGMSILHPSTPEERQKAINEAASKPSLFEAIREEWKGARPSEANLRVYLIRRKFASDALDRVIQIYRETVDLVTQESEGYNALKSEPPRSDEDRPPMHTATHAAAQPQTAPSAAAHPSVTPRREVEPYRLSLTPSGVEFSGYVTDQATTDKLIGALTALRALLPTKVTEPAEDEEAAS